MRGRVPLRRFEQRPKGDGSEPFGAWGVGTGRGHSWCRGPEAGLPGGLERRRRVRGGGNPGTLDPLRLSPPPAPQREGF